MLAGLAAPVGLLMLAVSDVVVEAADQLVPLARNCASSVLLLVVSVSAGFLARAELFLTIYPFFPKWAAGTQGYKVNYLTLGCYSAVGTLEGAWVYFWQWEWAIQYLGTVWKCKSDFYQMFLPYPRCHCVPQFGNSWPKVYLGCPLFFLCPGDPILPL